MMDGRASANLGWTIPGARMKSGRRHRLPLSAPAVRILRERHNTLRGQGHVFPGQAKGKPLSNIATHVADTLGWLKVRKKDFAGGLVLLNRAHSLEPDNAAITYHLVVALDANAKRGEALNLLKSLLSSGAQFADRPAALQLYSVRSYCPGVLAPMSGGRFWRIVGPVLGGRHEADPDHHHLRADAGRLRGHLQQIGHAKGRRRPAAGDFWLQSQMDRKRN
jgi:hypothetical protein